MPTHNISGSEADQRFAPAHGSIQMFPRRRFRWAGPVVFSFCVWAVLIVGAAVVLGRCTGAPH